MKIISFLVLFFIATASCYAPKHSILKGDKELQFLKLMELKKKKEMIEYRKQILIKSTILKEKPYNLEQAIKAYNREGVKGLLQVHAIMVTACNRIAGFNKFYLSDRTDSLKSVEMYVTYMSKHNPEYDYQKAAYLWNGGEGYEKANPDQKKRLEAYWKGLQQIISNIERKS